MALGASPGVGIAKQRFKSMVSDILSLKFASGRGNWTKPRLFPVATPTQENEREEGIRDCAFASQTLLGVHEEEGKN